MAGVRFPAWELGFLDYLFQTIRHGGTYVVQQNKPYRNIFTELILFQKTDDIEDVTL